MTHECRVYLGQSQNVLLFSPVHFQRVAVDLIHY